MTIYDIAQACNVSIATVSRVLNGSPKVSDKTRAKVLAVMNEQDYTPNPFARGLGLNSMKMIGILCTDIADTFYAKAIFLIERDLRKQGLDVILSCTGNELADKKKHLQFLLEKHVDAIILIGSPFRESEDNSHLANLAQKIPIITINSLIEAPNIYCVLCDDLEAMCSSVKALHHAGCDKILYLYDALTSSGRQKLAGYRHGLEACDLSEDARLLRRIPKTLAAAEAATAALLNEKIAFSAVLASEDLLAVGSQKALLKAGKRLPVIGFNNSILAECATPALTSVDNRLDVLCPTAIEILGKILAGTADLVPAKSIFPSVLVERESFALKP